jgi:hypothetical protein
MDRSAVLNVNEVENRSTERPPAPLTTDRLLDTLANAYRRRVVRRLAEREGSVPLERLIDDLAAAQDDAGADADEGSDREAVRIALYHSHLPKLVDDGVVVFDREESAVEPGPQLQVVAACLDALERTRERAR